MIAMTTMMMKMMTIPDIRRYVNRKLVRENDYNSGGDLYQEQTHTNSGDLEGVAQRSHKSRFASAFPGPRQADAADQQSKRNRNICGSDLIGALQVAGRPGQEGVGRNTDHRTPGEQPEKGGLPGDKAKRLAETGRLCLALALFNGAAHRFAQAAAAYILGDLHGPVSELYAINLEDTRTLAERSDQTLRASSKDGDDRQAREHAATAQIARLGRLRQEVADLQEVLLAE